MICTRSPSVPTLTLLVVTLAGSAACRAVDFVVRADGAGGAHSSVNAAIAAALASPGGASGKVIEIRANTAGTLQVFAQTIDLSPVDIASGNEADWLTVRVREGDRVRFRTKTEGALLSATGTSRGWKLEGNSLGPESLQFGDRADFVHTGPNTYKTCYPQTFGANIAATCGHYKIRNALFTGARSYYANTFDGADYELDTIAAFDHGTNHYAIHPRSGQRQDSGNLVRVRGVRVKMRNLTGLHGGHEGWGFECRSAVVRDSDFSGYWGDLSPSPGARATVIESVSGSPPHGPVLMEGVIVRDSGDSIDQPRQTAMKVEGNHVIVRDSFFFDTDSHLWQLAFTKAKAPDTGYFSGQAFYHNTSYVSKGTWWSDSSTRNPASGEAHFERNLIANNLFQEVSDNDRTPTPAQIIRYDTSGFGLNGFPNGFHGSIISGNAVGGPSPLKQVHLKTSAGGTTFPIDAPPSTPVDFTANVFENVVTTVTFAGVGEPRGRTKAGFAVTDWGRGAKAGDAPPLTTIAAASRGAAMAVMNARPFFDGWGIRGEVGDYIYIGATAAAAESAGAVRIGRIDYERQVITLTTDRPVRKGDGVWFGGNPANGGPAMRKNRGAHVP